MTFTVFGPQAEPEAPVGTFTGSCPIHDAAARTTPTKITTGVA